MWWRLLAFVGVVGAITTIGVVASNRSEPQVYMVNKAESSPIIDNGKLTISILEYKKDYKYTVRIECSVNATLGDVGGSSTFDIPEEFFDGYYLDRLRNVEKIASSSFEMSYLGREGKADKVLMQNLSQTLLKKNPCVNAPLGETTLLLWFSKEKSTVGGLAKVRVDGKMENHNFHIVFGKL